MRDDDDEGRTPMQRRADEAIAQTSEDSPLARTFHLRADSSPRAIDAAWERIVARHPRIGAFDWIDEATLEFRVVVRGYTTMGMVVVMFDGEGVSVAPM